uniref:DUF630 domain-containing protein n=1 Tax=Syphacia muris TaxID=451379 RepID=A0A0N5AVI5_9BILA
LNSLTHVSKIESFTDSLASFHQSINFCENYVSCAQRLEEKERECLKVQSERYEHQKLTSNCSKLSQRYRNYELRKTEVRLDCVRKTTNNFSTLVVSRILFHQERSCRRILRQYMSSVKSSKRQRTDEDVKKASKESLKKCRLEAKIWHKHCLQIAKCCPVYSKFDLIYI